VLAPFLESPATPPTAGRSPASTVHRLNDKLGTEAAAHAEIAFPSLTPPVVYPGLGPACTDDDLPCRGTLYTTPPRGQPPGCAAALDYARGLRGVREVAGGRLDASPFHPGHPRHPRVGARARFALAAHASTCWAW